MWSGEIVGPAAWVGVCGGVFGFDEVGTVFEIVSADAIASGDAVRGLQIAYQVEAA